MRSPRPAALGFADAPLGRGLVTDIDPGQAVVPAAALLHDSDGLAAQSLGAGTSIPAAAGAHSVTLRSAGASIIMGPRGGSDRALSLPSGTANSDAAFVEIAP